jgi:hypothetical protein
VPAAGDKQMANEQTKAYFNLKASLINQGWNEDAAKLEAYKRIFPARGEG